MNENSSISELMSHFAGLNIQEMTLRQGDLELHLRKPDPQWAGNSQSGTISPVTPATQQSTLDSSAPPPEKSAVPAALDDAALYTVTSPLVGTFYAAQAPGQPDFVHVGDRVTKGKPLCIVEAMKVMNTIEADVDGEIAEVLTKSGSLVEYGTPLFRIKV
ncbi:MAG TPA: acetyl-CoA carboxylase biotin carboxyl carrier protein [Fibrobacteraceae bacterium]|nr:acetyl-CoA carboxylase biotin carboxyl carrier protein [Fibrobacteraceae bacterium]